MRLLIALAAIAVPSASAPAHMPSGRDSTIVPPAQDPRVKPLRGGANCRRPDVHLIEREKGRKGKFNRLGELPPAQLMLTVYREVDGCSEPVIVRHGYGLGAPAARDRDAVPVMPRARRW